MRFITSLDRGGDKKYKFKAELIKGRLTFSIEIELIVRVGKQNKTREVVFKSED